MARKGGPAIQITGAKELRKALKRADVDVANLKDAHRAAGELVQRRAQEIAPRVSGDLAGSIRLDRRARGASISAGRGIAPYAGPIHFGWPGRNIEEQPFLYDAIDDRAAEVAAVYLREVAGIIGMIESTTL